MCTSMEAVEGSLIPLVLGQVLNWTEMTPWMEAYIYIDGRVFDTSGPGSSAELSSRARSFTLF